MGTLNVAYGPQITAAANRYGLDPRLLAAVAAQETGGPGANSGRNIVGDGGHGRGVFQIDDRWHSFAATPAAMDPQANANYAAGMISNLLQQNGGNVKAALSAYNAGSPTATGTTTTWGDGTTLGYADSVMRHYTQLAGAAPIATAGTSMTAATLAGAAANGTTTTDQTQADNSVNQFMLNQLQSMYQDSMSQMTSDLTSQNTTAPVDPAPKTKETSSTALLDTGTSDESAG